MAQTRFEQMSKEMAVCEVYEGSEIMNVELTNANDVFEDDNKGLIYGLQEVATDGSIGDYCEWFESEIKREKVIKDNNFKVI